MKSGNKCRALAENHRQTTTIIGIISRGYLSRGIRTGCYVLMLALLNSCFAQRNMIKDELTGLKSYVNVETPPKYNGGESFIHDFMSSFSFEYKQGEMMQSGFVVQFIIDKKGNLLGARIAGKKADELTRVETEVLNTLARLQDWVPAKNGRKNVNVLVTKRINIAFRM